MESLLAQLNTVPGVVGSLVSDSEGKVVAKVFPELFDTGMLQNVAKILSDGSVGLEAVTGPLGVADFRFGDSRLFVRPFPGALLLVLSTKSVNPELLSISSQIAVRKLEKLVADRKTAEAEAAQVAAAVRAGARPPPPPPRRQLAKEEKASEPPEEKKKEKPVRPPPKWWPSV